MGQLSDEIWFSFHGSVRWWQPVPVSAPVRENRYGPPWHSWRWFRENPVRLATVRRQVVVATLVAFMFSMRTVSSVREEPQTEARLCMKSVLIDIWECHFPVTAGIGSRVPLDYFKLEHHNQCPVSIRFGRTISSNSDGMKGKSFRSSYWVP